MPIGLLYNFLIDLLACFFFDKKYNKITLNTTYSSYCPGPLFARRLRYSRTGVSDLSQLVSPTVPIYGETFIAEQILSINKILISNWCN